MTRGRPTYWHQKVVLITGGSAGLGRSLVSSFASRGARVIVWARDAARLDHLVENGRQHGWEIEGTSVDITDDRSVAKAALELLSQYGRLDVLINNVGKSTRCDVMRSQLEQYRDLMEVNFFGLVRCTLAFLPSLVEQGGHVVNIGSLAGKTAWPFIGPYSTSKFAVTAFTQQLRLETPRPLHVMLACPGPIRRTDSGTRYQQESEALPESAKRPGAGAPMKGLDPDFVAQRIVRGCERRQAELILPRWPRLLFALGQLSASFGDWMIHRLKGTSRPNVAPPLSVLEPADENAASPV
ncbi:MAG: SDR family NAD(P)-dependent oxidoreductase [Pirellulaceae bacterium]